MLSDTPALCVAKHLLGRSGASTQKLAHRAWHHPLSSQLVLPTLLLYAILRKREVSCTPLQNCSKAVISPSFTEGLCGKLSRGDPLHVLSM